MKKVYKLENGSLYKSTKNEWIHVAVIPSKCEDLDDAIHWYNFGVTKKEWENIDHSNYY